MAQLGSGNGTEYPHTIDTYQLFQNAPTAAPDSATRIDAEVVMDDLKATVAVQTTLGARPNGDFASVAARLQQFMPGGGASPLFITFTSITSLLIPGTTHNLGTPAPLVQVYDANTPRQALEPESISIDTTTYDVTLTFATAQSGVVSLANPVPQYTTTFTSQTSVTILGATHGLGTPLLLTRIYSVSGLNYVLLDATITIHPTSYDVILTFATPQTGAVVISAAGPRYSLAFTSQTSLTVLGATHALGSPALLFQVYDAATPRQGVVPDAVTVHPITFDTTFTFVTPQSGMLLLVRATEVTGRDFQVRDGGITNSTAVRIYSEGGTLNLQQGSGNALRVRSAVGTSLMLVDGEGSAAFLKNLEIGGLAVKPGGGSWIAPSDERMKTRVSFFRPGLETLLQLEPIWFEYNGRGGVPADGRRYVGLLAQAAEAIAPYLVTRRPGKLDPTGEDTELLDLDPNPLLYLVLNAIKQLHQVQEAQEARLARLEALLLAQEGPSV